MSRSMFIIIDLISIKMIQWILEPKKQKPQMPKPDSTTGTLMLMYQMKGRSPVMTCLTTKVIACSISRRESVHNQKKNIMSQTNPFQASKKFRET